jgi:hypothetical protein
MAAHKSLSASSAHRWMNCAGSVALVGVEENIGSQPAMLGTAGHKIIEVMGINKETEASKYLKYTILVDETGEGETELHAPDDETPYLVNADGTPRTGWHAFVADEKMIDGVQMFVDEVERVKLTMFEPEEFNERMLDMSWLDDRLGGTADKTLVEPFGWAHLLDYKNGYIVVDVKDNEQLKTYAVGILHEHPDAEGVRVTIVQPNAPHEEGAIRTEEYTRDELKLFEIQMKEAADNTSKPNAPLRAGDWCMWCKAKTRCPEFEAKMAEEARADFSDDPPEALEAAHVDALAEATSGDNEQDETVYLAAMARKAKWVPLFDKWARDLEGEIQNAIMSGKAVPGFKLVTGKSKRKWGEDEATVRRMLNNELGSEFFQTVVEPLLMTDPKLKSPAQVEKIGADKDQRKAVKAAVALCAIKPPGRLTVAEAIDPRPAADPVQGALDDFGDDDPDE